MRLATAGGLACIALLTVSCALDDEDRCSPGQRYEGGRCVVQVDGGAADAAVAADHGASDTSGVASDGGAISGLDISGRAISGLGDTCSDQAGCRGKDATYCLIELGETEGICTVQDCSTAPDDCPAAYTCCDFAIPGVSNFCAPDADFETLQQAKMCS